MTKVITLAILGAVIFAIVFTTWWGFTSIPSASHEKLVGFARAILLMFSGFYLFMLGGAFRSIWRQK